MSATEQHRTAPRRWSAFVCPDCRFVFRLPGDHDGDGIVCPSCRRLLRIPGAEEETAPLMAPLKKIDFAGDDTPEAPKVKRSRNKRTRSKRKKKEKEAETPGWEASAGTWRASRKKGKRTLQVLAGWAATITLMVGVAYILVKANQPQKSTDGGEAAHDDGETAHIPLLLPDEELDEPIELPKIMQRSETELVALAKPLAEKFLTASRVEEILPLVRDGDRVKSLILARYPDGKIDPVGISKFNVTAHITYKDSFAAFSIQTPDFTVRQLAFFDGPEGLRIDWESWVGWSEVPWEKLIESRLKRPVLIRATLKWIEYYNFDFTEESKWRSYRLISPDGEHTLYGYAERNSLLDQRLRPGERSTALAVTLKVRFPETGTSRNQVVIEDFVADGWVVSDDGK